LEFSLAFESFVEIDKFLDTGVYMVGYNLVVKVDFMSVKFVIVVMIAHDQLIEHDFCFLIVSDHS